MELTAKEHLKKMGFNHIEIYTAQKVYHIDGLAKIMQDYHKAKVENLGLFNVTNRSEVLGKFYIHLSELAIIKDTCRNDKEMEEAINKFK